MDASETRIAEIIQGITCRNVPLDENQLSGGLLFEEVIKLAAMTVGFYAAEQGGALYRQPYNEVRTQACLILLSQNYALRFSRKRFI
jgi:hypothetical protein